MAMDQIPGGFWRPVAEGFIQRQIKKPFFGRAYLVFGECFSLWAYMMEMAGILAAKHAAKPDALVSALMGMSGAPGVAKRVLVAQAEKMVKQHSLGSMNVLGLRRGGHRRAHRPQRQRLAQPRPRGGCAEDSA
jgi:hypothetical protein